MSQPNNLARQTHKVLQSTTQSHSSSGTDIDCYVANIERELQYEVVLYMYSTSKLSKL